MQILKEEANGELYLASQYTSGMLPGMTPRQRQERKNQTAEYKERINRVVRKWSLVKLANANFEAGRDLFVCLTFSNAPMTERHCLQDFHRKMKKEYKEYGIEYKYICVREDHSMEGVPVRLHYHLFISGTRGPGMYRKIRKAIRKCWIYGEVDVRLLNNGGDAFESTVKYLLKQKRAKGERAYSCSRNLKQPAEPVRQRVPENARLETPPGVTVMRESMDANEFGRFAFCVGKIVNRKEFDAYWKKTKEKARPDPWRRMRLKEKYTAKMRC